MLMASAVLVRILGTAYSAPADSDQIGPGADDVEPQGGPHMIDMQAHTESTRLRR